MAENLGYCAEYQFSLFRNAGLIDHSRTSSTRALTRAFPPVGSDKMVLQRTQLTGVDAFPKMTCSFLHFEQRTFTNFDVGCSSIFILLHLHALGALSFFLCMGLLADLA